MVEQEWMRFEHSGSVNDYLAYSRAHETRDTGTGCYREMKGSSDRDGADHCAYRYGAGGDPHRGI